MKEGKFDEIIERVKIAYDVILCNLSQYSNISIGILPVQTVGNILFSGHRLGFILSDGQRDIRCSYLDHEGGDLILSDGQIVRGVSDANLNLDSKMQFGSITIPYSWFKIADSFYSPRNCDMLAYHILQFLLVKTMDSKRKEESNKSKWTLKKIALTMATVMVGGIYGVFALWAYSELKKRFGSLDIDKLQKSLDDIASYRAGEFKEDEMYLYKSNIR